MPSNESVVDVFREQVAVLDGLPSLDGTGTDLVGSCLFLHHQLGSGLIRLWILTEILYDEWVAALHLAPPLLPVDLINLNQPSLFLVALGIYFIAKDLFILRIR